MKTFFRNIHLYLSLLAGVVIMIACITGAILVFEKELQEAFNPGRYSSTESGKPLPLEQVLNSVKSEYPEARVVAVKTFTEPGRNLEIGLSIPPKEIIKTAGKPEKGEGPKGKPAGGEGRASHTAFVNPYSGAVVELYSYRETFFYKVFALHRWLLGSNDGIGKYIVGVSTFIFLFILLTGIILWWPKTRRILTQRLKIKGDGGWKRLNHDLHLVLGFYSSIFLFIFAFTAMSWSFKWFNKGIARVTNSSLEAPEPPVSAFRADGSSISYDDALKVIKNKFANAVSFQIRGPKDSTGVYSITVLEAGRMENATDTYYLDQYSGEIAGTYTFEQKNLGQQVRAYVKPVHTGSVFGMPSKIISLIVCVLGATFPVTGTIMWLNRLKKGKKRGV